MSSRQEEKAQRRAEREEAERKAASSQSRTARTRALIAGLVTVAAVVAVVLLATGGGGGSDDASAPDSSGGGAPVPAQKERNLEKAAEAAGCKLQTFPGGEATHVTEPVEYEMNPPTSGNHHPEAALDGIYAIDNPPAAENTVHSLEHGRINFQYRPGTPAEQIAQLETVASEELNGKAAYKTLLFENQTKMKAAVAATGWTQSLTCPELTDATFDALRTFRVTYVDKGPEQGIPPNN